MQCLPRQRAELRMLACCCKPGQPPCGCPVMCPGSRNCRRHCMCPPCRTLEPAASRRCVHPSAALLPLGPPFRVPRLRGPGAARLQAVPGLRPVQLPGEWLCTGGWVWRCARHGWVDRTACARINRRPGTALARCRARQHWYSPCIPPDPRLVNLPSCLVPSPRRPGRQDKWRQALERPFVRRTPWLDSVPPATRELMQAMQAGARGGGRVVA